MKLLPMLILVGISLMAVMLMAPSFDDNGGGLSFAAADSVPCECAILWLQS